MKHVFLPHKLVCGKLMCFAFGLSLDLVVGYADWSHTFWSCNLGRNGSDNFVMAYSSLLREKKPLRLLDLKLSATFCHSSIYRGYLLFF